MRGSIPSLRLEPFQYHEAIPLVLPILDLIPVPRPLLRTGSPLRDYALEDSVHKKNEIASYPRFEPGLCASRECPIRLQFFRLSLRFALPIAYASSPLFLRFELGEFGHQQRDVGDLIVLFHAAGDQRKTG